MPNCVVNVLSLKRLRQFWQKHPQAEKPLRDGYKTMRKAEFNHFGELKEVFGSADYSDPVTIFDVRGNKYRLVVRVVYSIQCAYIVEVFTHKEYDHWNKSR